MLPERYQGVPCASVRANSSKMRRCAAQPSHLSSSLHPAPPRKPKASPPVIAEWHQPLSAAACSLTRLLLHMKPALAAVRRVARSAFHVQRRNRTHPCQTLQFGRLLHARPSAAVHSSASCIKEPALQPSMHSHGVARCHGHASQKRSWLGGLLEGRNVGL